MPTTPRETPGQKRVVWNQERVQWWLSQGAQPSKRVEKLLITAGVMSTSRLVPEASGSTGWQLTASFEQRLARCRRTDGGYEGRRRKPPQDNEREGATTVSAATLSTRRPSDQLRLHSEPVQGRSACAHSVTMKYDGRCGTSDASAPEGSRRFEWAQARKGLRGLSVFSTFFCSTTGNCAARGRDGFIETALLEVLLFYPS